MSDRRVGFDPDLGYTALPYGLQEMAGPKFPEKTP